MDLEVRSPFFEIQLTRIFKIPDCIRATLADAVAAVHRQRCAVDELAGVSGEQQQWDP